MKFLRSLLNLHDIGHCLTENTRRIKNIEGGRKVLANGMLDNRTDISNIQVAITQILTRVKKLEDNMRALNDYTNILSGRIAKLKGKDNEKKNNLTGQEDTNI